MDNLWILNLSDPQSDINTVGGKAASLSRLSQAGLPVPGGFSITTAAYRQFVLTNDLKVAILEALVAVDLAVPSSIETASASIRARFDAALIPDDLRQAILDAYAAIPGETPAVAVRSSATAEDLPGASFAGQQETYLNIAGEQAVLEAVKRCWSSLWTARAISYRARQAISPQQVALAVVVQELVPADAAGILFTANPVTGARGQILVNAAWGLGEAIVGGMVTPDAYTLDKASGQVISEEIADKVTMTIRTPTGTEERPVPAALRTRPALQESHLQALCRLGVQIEALYGMPMDIEWALSRGELAVLQARPVTALPEANPEVKMEWRLPNPKGRYIRGSIIDFMPDPLTPLFASMVAGGMNQSLEGLFVEFTGKRIDMYKNYFFVINGFPYVSTSFSAGQWLQLLVNLIPIGPRLLRDSLRFWKEKGLPRYQAVVSRWEERDLSALSSAELQDGVVELMKATTDHLSILMVATLGAAAGAEAIFTWVYEKLVRRENDPSTITYLVGFESKPIHSEKSLFDLAAWAGEQPELAEYLRHAPAGEIAACLADHQAPDGLPGEQWMAFEQRLREHLSHFGYSIYDLDFSRPLPMDEPGILIEAIKLFLSGGGKNPYERQHKQVENREAATKAIFSREKGLKAWVFRKTLGMSQAVGPSREDSIAEIGLSYPVLRSVLKELGGRLAEADIFHEAADIYWLEYSELQQAVGALEAGSGMPDLTGVVTNRNAEWEAREKITPPTQLPEGKQIKFLGIEFGRFLGVHAGNETGATIKGLGASPGLVTAVARVLNGPEDFDQMRPGDVLVASITTPAWTPLFMLASAVVTDIGGPLSHGSIVAREYGIPAVLGTGVATRRITSGQRVTVDGTKGIITMLDGE